MFQSRETQRIFFLFHYEILIGSGTNPNTAVSWFSTADRVERWTNSVLVISTPRERDGLPVLLLIFVVLAGKRET